MLVHFVEPPQPRYDGRLFNKSDTHVITRLAHTFSLWNEVRWSLANNYDTLSNDDNDDDDNDVYDIAL